MRQILPNKQVPEHFGLAYEVWAPVGKDGKVPDSERAKWLGQIADMAIAADYARSYARWKASFSAAGDRTFELKLVSRLLIGHGNTSATDVGLTVHHWGDKVTVTRVEDPGGKGKIKFQADDGLLGQFAGESPPDIPIGATIEVWIANVNQGNYTFTRKPPKDKPKGKSK